MFSSFFRLQNFFFILKQNGEFISKNLCVNKNRAKGKFTPKNICTIIRQFILKKHYENMAFFF